MYIRSQLMEIANSKGYDIKNNDISWLIHMNIIHPGELTKAIFSYDDEDLEWVEKLGELKLRGLEKSVIEKIFTTGTSELVFEFLERARYYSDSDMGECE